MAVTTIDPETYAAAQQALQQQPADTGTTWATINNFLNSKAGQAAIGAAGAGISAYGQSKTASANRAENARQFDVSQQNDLATAQVNDARARQLGTLQAQPQGSDLAFAQKQALMAAILPGLRNYSVSSPDPAVKIPQISGGFQLPANGLPQSVLDLYSPAATAASLGQYEQNLKQLNPQAAPTPYAAYGLPQPQTAQPSAPAGTPGTTPQSAVSRDALMRAIDGNLAGSGTKVPQPGAPQSAATPSYTQQLVAQAIGAGGASAASPFTPTGASSTGNSAAPARTPQIAGYAGGTQAPDISTLSGPSRQILERMGGVLLSPDDVKELQARGWTWGQPAPDGYTYDSAGILHKEKNNWKEFGRAAATGGSIVLAGATAGATSPWTAAAIGAGSGALAGGVNGGAKGALLGAALGAAGGAAGPALSTANAGTRIGVQAGIGAAQGGIQGGTRGALLGAAGGAGNAAIGQAGQIMTNNGVSPATQLAVRAALQGGLNYELSGGSPLAAGIGAGQGAIAGAAGNAAAQRAAANRQQLAQFLNRGETPTLTYA